MNEILQNAIDRYCTESIWSGSYYLLPDGTLLYFACQHAGFFEDLEAHGIRSAIGDKAIPDYLASLGWIRLNTWVRYIRLNPIPPTETQYAELAALLNFIKNDVSVTFPNGKITAYEQIDTPKVIAEMRKSYEK